VLSEVVMRENKYLKRKQDEFPLSYSDNEASDIHQVAKTNTTTPKKWKPSAN